MIKRGARSLSILLAALIFIGACIPALASPELTRTLNEIFVQHEFDAKNFGPARWLDGGVAYTTVEPSPAFPNTDARDIVRYETATGARTVLVSASQLVPAPGSKPLRIDDYAWSQDSKRLLIYTNSKKVWRQNTRGDYWVLYLDSGKLQKLGGDVPASTLMFAQFSPDGHSVAYVRDHNIYVEDLASETIRPLTTDGAATLINGTSDWANEEEMDIRNGFRWSPDGQSIAYWQFDTTGVGIYTLINDTAEEYPTLKQYPYPQVGTTNSAVRVGVVSAEGGPTRWMNVPGDPREHYIARMDWAGNSNQLVLEVLNRLQNQNKVLLADVHTGSVRKVMEDTDPAWLDVVESFQWADGGKSLLWLSERDGWRHVYKVSRSGGPLNLLTHGPLDVMKEVAVDNRNGWLYYIASPINATQRYLYRVGLDGSGSPQRITPMDEPGTHSYDISPNGLWAFHKYSTADHPPVTDLIRLPSHQSVRILESNEALDQKVKALIASPTKFFQVTIDGGVTLDGWMMQPRDFDPAKKYPVLVYVYGEPAAVTVTDKWGGDTTLFHRAIANDGYIILSFDNQGTPAPKGRAWRKIVFGSLGPLSSAQQSEAIRQFAREHSYIDTSRMAIWGWSGGGSNTLNLMFRYPGLFSTGMAVAPMADQRHYDTIYQERYMGLPKDNPKGYHDGSPINFAEGLQGKLLIVHGSGDDNCHFQVTELLVNRLIALGKSFDFMDYPNRTHALSEGPGTSFHLRSLLARYLEEHVPPGGQPQ
ncbi:MAG TPA: S9 family peptidase [Acidobacteriaceae bacterium]|nr:S9 family peptidase [Acidobacteriaceae bacterium]